MPPRPRRETCNQARTCRRIFSSRGKSAASGRVPGRAPSVPCWWRHSATRTEGRKASAVDGRPAPAARSAEFREPPNRWCAIPARAHLALQHQRRRTALLLANVARCSAANRSMIMTSISCLAASRCIRIPLTQHATGGGRKCSSPMIPNSRTASRHEPPRYRNPQARQGFQRSFATARMQTRNVSAAASFQIRRRSRCCRKDRR